MPVTFDSENITPEYIENYYRRAEGAPWLEKGENYISDPGNKFRLALIAEELERLKPARILDVGCGGMALAEAVAEKLRGEYVACDLAAPDHIPAGILYAVSDAARLPFQNEYFDAVVCSEVLEHLYDPGQALQEIARVLKHGGRAIITVPNWFSLDSLDGATGLISAAAKSGILPGLKFGVNVHLTKAAPAKWTELIERNGLKVETSRPVFLFPYIPYVFKGLKKIESGLFKHQAFFDFWRRTENTLGAHYPFGSLGQFHYFHCSKQI